MESTKWNDQFQKLFGHYFHDLKYQNSFDLGQWTIYKCIILEINSKVCQVTSKNQKMTQNLQILSLYQSTLIFEIKRKWLNVVYKTWTLLLHKNRQNYTVIYDSIQKSEMTNIKLFINWVLTWIGSSNLLLNDNYVI